MLLEVLRYPDPRLRKKADAITSVNASLTELAHSMLETMYHSKGIGLAATQVGQLVRLLVVDTRAKDENGEILLDEMSELEAKIPQPLVVFNPEILLREDKTSYEEGCLSVPGFYENVERANLIELEYLDIEGKKCHLRTDGLLAICLQHEMDHLDGKLFIDRLSLLKSTKIRNRIKKSGYPTPEEAAEERRKKRSDVAL